MLMLEVRRRVLDRGINHLIDRSSARPLSSVGWRVKSPLFRPA
jgi:hypothetical protein